jgi:hypothetical protein
VKTVAFFISSKNIKLNQLTLFFKRYFPVASFALILAACSDGKNKPADISGKWFLEEVTLINSIDDRIPYDDGGINDPIIWDVDHNQIVKNYMDEGVSKSNAFPYSIAADSSVTEQIKFKLISVNDTLLILKTTDSVEEFTGMLTENCVKELRFRKAR